MNENADVNTKEALLEAAIKVFADKGFDSATVRDICSRANANVAAINYHFGSKDGLYVAVLEEVFPKDDAPVGNESIENPEERLRAYLRDLAGEIFERGNDMVTYRWAIFLREMAKPSHNLDFIVRRSVQKRADDLRAIVRDILGPEVPEATMGLCSANIWALMMDRLLTEPIIKRLTPQRPDIMQDIDAFVDHVLKFSLGGLKAIKENTE